MSYERQKIVEYERLILWLLIALRQNVYIGRGLQLPLPAFA